MLRSIYPTSYVARYGTRKEALQHAFAYVVNAKRFSVEMPDVGSDAAKEAAESIGLECVMVKTTTKSGVLSVECLAPGYYCGALLAICGDYTPDLRALRKYCKSKNKFFVIDATQSALPAPHSLVGDVLCLPCVGGYAVVSKGLE